MPEPVRTRVSHRRNGLQAACEPCRKAKVRCDISSTNESICSRCRKRKDPSRCQVLDAPMTQSKPATPIVPVQSSATSPLSTLLSTSRSMSSAQERFKAASGYLGSTSFSATIQPDDDQNEDVEMAAENVEGPESIDSTERLMMLQILESIPDEKTCAVLIKSHNKHIVGIVVPKLTLTFILEAFWEVFRSFMRRPRTGEEVERLAGIIDRNGHSPLEEPDDALEWHKSFSGIKTRWESVGVMLVGFAYGFMSLSEADFSRLPDNVTKRGRKSLIAVMKKSTENCMYLSRNSLNLISLSLLHKNLLLETVIHGDFCLSVWRLHHDAVAVATAIGLHAYKGGPTITFKSEMKKRLSGGCFWNDKEIAMFTGRPPALSHRHFSCPLPSDVSDEALMEGGERLQDELAQVDDEGWNTQGKMYDATICRIMACTAIIQDEVMELFIGNEAQFSMERVQQIKLKTAETFGKNLLKTVHVTKEYIAAQDDYTMWRLMFGRLDYLRIHFLLERLCVERSSESKQSLLDVSREIVDLVVYIWLSRDRSVGRHHDFDYIIMCYGMPSVGILCSELLVRIRQPKTDSIRFPVSEVVQNFSLLIGFLEWIKPAAGNYKLCQRMARVLKRVLDQVFDPKPEIAERVERNEQTLDVDVIGNLNRDGSFWFPDGNNDLDWLNSIDWSKGMLMDLN